MTQIHNSNLVLGALFGPALAATYCVGDGRILDGREVQWLPMDALGLALVRLLLFINECSIRCCVVK
jgi:hypothetical protein